MSTTVSVHAGHTHQHSATRGLRASGCKTVGESGNRRRSPCRQSTEPERTEKVVAKNLYHVEKHNTGVAELRGVPREDQPVVSDKHSTVDGDSETVGET